MSEHHPKPALSPEVLEAFASAAMIALQELARCEAVRGDQDANPLKVPDQALIAVIRLQRNVPGTLTLIVPEEVAFQLAQSYLPAGAHLTCEIIDDVVGEFANVTAGQAKTILKGTPYHFALSLPAVSHRRRSVDLAASTLRLATPAGLIWLAVELPPCPGA
jgi:CheY-specific phosphatase CheX